MASEFVNKRPNSANIMAKTLDPEKLSLEDLTSEKRKMANVLYSSKEYKKALEVYNELVELSPNVSRNYHNRAACYMMLYQYQGALADAKKSIELDPSFLKAYARAIKCSCVLGDIVDAETTLSKLLELDPTNEAANCERKVLNYIQTYLETANNAYASKDFRQVVFCMDRCCDVSTHCKQFKLTKAECLVFLGRYQEAQDIANDVLHIDKQNVDAIYIRGMCFYFQDNVERAFPHFQQVLRLAPDHTKALELYKRAKSLKKKKEDGNAAFKMERYQEAYNLYNEALGIDPQNTMTNAKLYFNKATAAAKLGRLNESVANCTEALKLNVNYLKALLRRAASYMELKKYEEAVRDLEAACKIDKSRENKRLLLEAKMALKISKRKDYYMILGIDRNASTDDIKKAYRKRAMVHHPDRHANASEGEKKEQEKKFIEVGEAYGILSDPKERLRYDNQDNYDDGDLHNVDPNDLFRNFFAHNGDYQYQTRGFPSSFTFQFR